MVDVKRSYRSPLRRQAAQATRRAILDAARGLFLEEGYAAVTMKRVAEVAGVASQTVYAVFGSKTDLLLALDVRLDSTVDRGPDPGPDGIAAPSEPAGPVPPAALLEAGARLQRRLFERNYDYLETLRRAALADRRLATGWHNGQRRHREGVARTVRQLRDDGALREDLSVEEAVDATAAICNLGVYTSLVKEAGWSPDRYQEWLADTMQRLLLRAD